MKHFRPISLINCSFNFFPRSWLGGWDVFLRG
jgi:hypothetical protein